MSHHYGGPPNGPQGPYQPVPPQGFYPPPPPPPPKKRTGLKIAFAVIGAFLLFGGCMAAISNAGNPAAPVAGRTSIAKAQPTTSAEADADSDSDSDAATEEAPTATPTPTPTVKPRAYKGVGAKVLRLKRADVEEAWLATFTHTGGSNFIVRAVTPEGDEADVLVNEIGRYKGTVLLNNSDNDATAALNIKADGAWTVTLKPIAMVPLWDGQKMSGRGDEVLGLTQTTSGVTTMTARHTGTSNFILHGYSDDGVDVLINEIGRWKGEVLLSNGTFLITIHADGAWNLTRG